MISIIKNTKYKTITEETQTIGKQNNVCPLPKPKDLNFLVLWQYINLGFIIRIIIIKKI